MKHLSGDFRWSFSKLSSFEHCPMSFYLEYVCNPSRDDEIPNFFSEYGSFAHKLLEGYFKNEIPQFLLAEEWAAGYERAVTCPPPPFPAGYGEKAYNAGLAYFESFDGFGEEWEVVSVENKFVIDIHGYQMVGIADLVLRHKETGELWVIDHKSKSSSSMRKDLPTYRHQLYIYAMWLKEKFGVYPTKLSFNLFKEKKMVDEVFSEDQVEDTVRWILSMIEKIETCDLFEDWPPCIPEGAEKEPYFCTQICGCKDRCDRYQEVRQISYQNYLAKKQAEEGFVNAY